MIMRKIFLQIHFLHVLFLFHLLYLGTKYFQLLLKLPLNIGQVIIGIHLERLQNQHQSRQILNHHRHLYHHQQSHLHQLLHRRTSHRRHRRRSLHLQLYLSHLVQMFHNYFQLLFAMHLQLLIHSFQLQHHQLSLHRLHQYFVVLLLNHHHQRLLNGYIKIDHLYVYQMLLHHRQFRTQLCHRHSIHQHYRSFQHIHKVFALYLKIFVLQNIHLFHRYYFHDVHLVLPMLLMYKYLPLGQQTFVEGRCMHNHMNQLSHSSNNHFVYEMLFYN